MIPKKVTQLKTSLPERLLLTCQKIGTVLFVEQKKRNLRKFKHPPCNKFFYIIQYRNKIIKKEHIMNLENDQEKVEEKADQIITFLMNNDI